jgi:hypothetical protein
MLSHSPGRNSTKRAPTTPLRWKSYANRGLKIIPDQTPSFHIVSLDLSDNPFKDFQGLQLLPYLRVLRIDNSLIGTFRGARVLPALEILSLANAPITLRRYFPVMTLLSFGTSIRVVNGCQVSDALIRTAKDSRTRKLFVPYLLDGYLIVDFDEKIVCRPGTSGELMLDLDPAVRAEQQAKIDGMRRQIAELKTQRAKIKRELDPSAVNDQAPAVADQFSAVADQSAAVADQNGRCDQEATNLRESEVATAGRVDIKDSDELEEDRETAESLI